MDEMPVAVGRYEDDMLRCSVFTFVIQGEQGPEWVADMQVAEEQWMTCDSTTELMESLVSEARKIIARHLGDRLPGYIPRPAPPELAGLVSADTQDRRRLLTP